MKLKPFASNMIELELDDYLILFSYSTPVAYHRPGVGFFRTNKKWSVTTSRHINKWLAHHGAHHVTEIAQEFLDSLVDTMVGVS